ncbi:MAG: hypothetical protein CEE38_18535 [Planctomycetes bacterium B3_Pla]|nr:MAG: hypothetical protein CEE38_18535 [Planctomycetes bacterium B3_Pla]
MDEDMRRGHALFGSGDLRRFASLLLLASCSFAGHCHGERILQGGACRPQRTQPATKEKAIPHKQKQIMRSEEPYIVSFVSGKGGVGKTMLAVAFAKELSLGSPTLLIDLDFFNRGLSALLGSKNPITTVPKPRFLRSNKTTEDDTWSVVKSTNNLYHITYPDLRPSEMRRFATLPVERLADALKEFVQQTAEKCGCSFVVLDCHGGPDNSSFAASIISDDTLLISEPDRVTFRGTLNFLRQLDTASDESDLQIHLVFNKVVPHFSGFFLKTFYNRTIRSEFGGRPLLGIFPLEVYLTKEFEKQPFLTKVYPNSLLAKKTRLMIHTLLASRRRVTLSPAIRKISRPVRWFRMMSLGKLPWFLDSNKIMFLLVAFLVLSLFGNHVLSLHHRPGKLGDFFGGISMSSVAGALVVGLLTLWVVFTLFIGWFRMLDRKFVYFMRAKSHSLAVPVYLALCATIFPALWGYGAAIGLCVREYGSPTDSPGELAVLCMLALFSAGFLSTQAWKTYRLRLERQPLEMALRTLFFIYLLVASSSGALMTWGEW